MALELDKVGYAGIGLLAKMQDLIEEFVEGRTEEEAEPVAEEAKEVNLQERFEQLVELGEERYDEWLDKGKESREKVADKIKERANKIFSEIGLVTREDIEDLEDKISKLQRAIKKAATPSKKA
ncbi:MAG TPA: phasin family protein [bacterium]|nr:MAG: Poly(hydroxyalcanoate) granule associated protein (phasin) [bacterium ADurb.Bin236]HOY64981.1 phasin family protein [bacterium]HPI75980.1 phasin family protein [bacterium]HPN93331.1 phasin family protein [bacterium]